LLSACVEAHDATLKLSIRDDGIGGADFSKGSRLIGLKDLVGTVAGTMAISNEAGHGTSLLVKIPLEAQ
jgi:signal transduction histidine kinase